jgi:hypothetical protein
MIAAMSAFKRKTPTSMHVACLDSEPPTRSGASAAGAIMQIKAMQAKKSHPRPKSVKPRSMISTNRCTFKSRSLIN